jgi:hypothetical protein
MSRSLRVSLVQTVRRWLLPLGCYYVVTLAVPFANGAARHGAIFANHALVVLVFPLLLIVLLCACGTFAEVCRRTGSALLHSEVRADPALTTRPDLVTAGPDPLHIATTCSR